MTAITVAKVLYALAVILIVIGILELANILHWTDGTGIGCIVVGIICAVVGAVLDRRRPL